jgi:hypothetical protein
LQAPAVQGITIGTEQDGKDGKGGKVGKVGKDRQMADSTRASSRANARACPEQSRRGGSFDETSVRDLWADVNPRDPSLRSG